MRFSGPDVSFEHSVVNNRLKQFLPHHQPREWIDLHLASGEAAALRFAAASPDLLDHVSACCREKGLSMPQVLRGGRLPALAFAAALCLITCPAAEAEESSASVIDAEQYIAAGDLKAAASELKNAI